MTDTFDQAMDQMLTSIQEARLSIAETFDHFIDSITARTRSDEIPVSKLCAILREFHPQANNRAICETAKHIAETIHQHQQHANAFGTPHGV